MSSAQLDLQHLEDAVYDAAPAPATPFALKEQAAERIAAHRARRQGLAPAPVAPVTPVTPQKARAAKIAAAVAERYAQSQSYRAFLAAEAQRAIDEAEAAAHVAARTAQAVADAQYTLIAELDQLVLTPPEPTAPTLVHSQPRPAAFHQPAVATKLAEAPILPRGPITVRLIEDLAPPISDLSAAHTNTVLSPSLDPYDDEGQALDEEIAFRQSPVFEPSTPPVEIAANLIEFPRQLVAARRARPRIAEGPLREDAQEEHNAAQLRIFEVEATQMSPAPALESSATEWSSIMLGAHPAIVDDALYAAEYAPHYAQNAPAAAFNPELPPATAPIDLRLMAAAVDSCIVITALVAFTAVAAVTIGDLPVGQLKLQNTAIATGGTFALLSALYQLLFFTLSDRTPGMRYARIALCTFSDENPSRSAMRRRVLALFLSVCPLGIGILWAWLDPDRLGWHDRISRMYQRSY